MNIDKIKGESKKIFESKTFKKIITGFGILLIAGFIFEAGVFAGFHRASFGRDWGDNYSRNFGPIHRGRMGDMFKPESFPNAHGAIGKIIKIELPNIIVSDKDGTEKIVTLSDDTDIRLMHEDISKDKLAIDNFVVVIGSPNPKGQIEAKLIRVLPAPNNDTSSSQTNTNTLNSQPIKN